MENVHPWILSIPLPQNEFCLLAIRQIHEIRTGEIDNVDSEIGTMQNTQGHLSTCEVWPTDVIM